MHTIQEHMSTTARSNGGHSIVAAITGRIARWRQARQVERELSMLSTRELSDLGLSPGDIHAVARGTFRMPD